MTTVQEVFEMIKRNAKLPQKWFEQALPSQLEARKQLSPEDQEVLDNMACDDPDLYLSIASKEEEPVWIDKKKDEEELLACDLEALQALWKHLLGAKLTLADEER